MAARGAVGTGRSIASTTADPNRATRPILAGGQQVATRQALTSPKKGGAQSVHEGSGLAVAAAMSHAGKLHRFNGHGGDTGESRSSVIASVAMRRRFSRAGRPSNVECLAVLRPPVPVAGLTVSQQIAAKSNDKADKARRGDGALVLLAGSRFNAGVCQEAVDMCGFIIGLLSAMKRKLGCGTAMIDLAAGERPAQEGRSTGDGAGRPVSGGLHRIHRRAAFGEGRWPGAGPASPHLRQP